MTENGEWASLYKRAGSRSRFAGLGFVGLTVVLLLLSYVTQYIVFEIDSIIAFLAALVLLFSEPRRRIQSSVIDAVISSNEMSIAELAAKQSDSYEYVPSAKGVSGVTMIPLRSESGVASPITPPGRALAELFAREAGIPRPNFDSLQASLSSVMTENFGLARSVRLSRDQSSVRVLLESPSFECPCGNDAQPPKLGVPGCTVASFLAVLVCSAEARPVSLTSCERDRVRDTWGVRIQVGPEGVSA